MIAHLLLQPRPRQILAVALLMAAGTSLLGCSCADSDGGAQGLTPYKHVVLISLDTTRADALGVYGGTAAKTPRLDKLAKSGIRFAQTTSAAPSTLASHTSIMTGLHPRRHGVARNAFSVSPDNVMMAEVLKEQGFHTAGFIASFALDEMFDFNQGFDHWDQEFSIEADLRNADQNQRPADLVTGAVLDYVANFDGSQRLFLFAHYFDVHAPYAPPQPFAKEYGEEWQTSDFGHIDHQVTKHQEELIGKKRAIYNKGLTRKLVEGAHGNPLPGDTNLSSLYAGELAFLDAQLGRLFDGLEERGILQDSIVILTADHGETFWEHGDFWHHGAWVYETNVHVPFLVYLPDGRGRGEVVETPVSTTDIFPTLLDLLGIDLPEPVAGRSLVAAIDGGALTPVSIFSEATQPVEVYEKNSTWRNQLKTKSVRFGQWKYIQTPYLKYEELYDLAADPGEQENLLKDSNPEHAKVLGDLRAKLEAWRIVEQPRESIFDATQMKDAMERLKSLGYTGDLGEIDEQE